MGKTSAQHVLGQYDVAPTEVQFLDHAGGFSGAELWKIAAPASYHASIHSTVPSRDPSWLCLRRWPRASPDVTRLAFIHEFIEALASSGLPVPRPLRTTAGATFVTAGGRLWELTPWMPGVADFQRDASDARLQAAMASLARMHLASAAWRTPIVQPSNAVRQRFQMLAQTDGWVQRLATVHTSLPASWQPAARELLRVAPAAAKATQRRFADVTRLTLPAQWVVKDIWHDHLLFQGDVVSGIVDFGAMGWDTIATDLSRLLGSLLGNAWPRWSIALDAYSQERSLSAAERETVAALDQAAVALSGLNWLQWVGMDGRRFPGRESEILQRIEALVSRLTDGRRDS